MWRTANGSLGPGPRGPFPLRCDTMECLLKLGIFYYKATAQRRSKTALDPEQFTAKLAELCEGTSGYLAKAKALST